MLTQSPWGGGPRGAISPTTTTSGTVISSETGRSNETHSVSRVSYPTPTPLANSNRNGSVPNHASKALGSGKENNPFVGVTPALTIPAEADDGRKSSESRKRKLTFQLQDDDDDVFAGLDLDALEEEATVQARAARSTQGVCPTAVMPSFDLGFEDSEDP